LDCQEIVEYLDLAQVWPIEVSSNPSYEQRASVREQRVSDVRSLTLGWKPEEVMSQVMGGQPDAQRNRA
jgi:hypothetical protein